MKLKNVHLPHPHPNGGFWDSSLGGRLVLSSVLHFVELVVGGCEMITGAAAAREFPVVVFLSSWVGISTKSRAHILFIHVLALICMQLSYDYTSQKSLLSINSSLCSRVPCT